MKIVLSARELESMRGFMEEYKESYIESLIASLSDQDKVNFSIESAKSELDAEIQESKEAISSMVVMGETSEGEYIVDVAEDVFVAYMKACGSTTVAIRKYSIEATELYVKHKDTIEKVINRAKCLLDKKFIKNMVTTAAKFLGAEEIVTDILGLGTKITEDEKLKLEFNRIGDEFFESIDKYC